jgi:hypothetical protein
MSMEIAISMFGTIIVIQLVLIRWELRDIGEALKK